jgi:hypothetical protein
LSLHLDSVDSSWPPRNFGSAMAAKASRPLLPTDSPVFPDIDYPPIVLVDIGEQIEWGIVNAHIEQFIAAN